MKKLLTSKIKAGNEVKAVREVVKNYKTQKQDEYDDTAEILKPSIEVQKKVKKTIDAKQDELIKEIKENKETIDRKQDEVIKQLKDNQNELIKSVDVLSEIMSQQGSQPGIHSWLSGLPSQFDPLDMIPEVGEERGEEGGEEGEVYDTYLGPESSEEVKPSTSEKKPLKENPFTISEEQIIKKYGFDPTLENIRNESSIKKKLYLQQQAK